MNVKRSSDEERQAMRPGRGGVGARLEQTHLPPGGGGYLDICNLPNFAYYAKKNREEISLADLKQVLPASWYSVARTIGAALFIDMWLVLLSEVESSENYGRLTIPAKGKLARLARDRIIGESVNEGRTAIRDIKSRLAKSGINCSTRSVQRVVSRI